MIAIHLLPFPFRGARAPYLWVFHAALSKLGANASYILSAEYLDAGGGASHLSSAIRKSLAQASYSLIPDQEMRSFADSYPTRELAWCEYLTREIPQLNEIYERALAALPDIETISAVVTWCNCPSLAKACQARNIRVIHQEIGSLRPPGYLPTIYFDFSGVNGNTDVAARYARLEDEEQTLPVFSRQELLSIFSAAEVDRNIRFKRGVALQVEDDSNIIAFANGFNSTALINQALEEVSPADIIVRDHPVAHFDYKQRDNSDPVRDESATTAGFLAQIEHLYTINSSLGCEALLHGIPVTCFGDAPYKFVTTKPWGSPEFVKRLSFYCLNYLVPEEFLFDEEYLNWRLGAPSELQIQEKHLKAHAFRSLPPTIFAQVYFDVGDGFSEENSVKTAVIAGDKRIVFDGFSPDTTIKALRFDPLNDHVAVRIQQISLLRANNEAAVLSIASTNADYADVSGLFFMQRDPIVSLEVPGGSVSNLKQVVVELEFIACGPSEVRSQFRRQSIQALANQQQLIAQRDQIAADRQSILLDRDRVLVNLQKITGQRDQVANERDQIAADRQLISLDRDRIRADLQHITAQRDQGVKERDQIAADREVVSIARDRVIADLQQMTAQRDQAVSQVQELDADRQVISFDRNRIDAELREMTALRDEAVVQCEQIAADRKIISLERDRLFAELELMTVRHNRTASERDEIADSHQLILVDRDRVAGELQQMAVQRDQALRQRDEADAECRLISLERERVLADLRQMAARRDQTAGELGQIAADRQVISLERDRVVDDLHRMAAQHDRVSAERDALATTVHLLKQTHSWRFTGPLRWAGGKLRRLSRKAESGASPYETWVSEHTDGVTVLEVTEVDGNGNRQATEEYEFTSSAQHFAQLFFDAGDGFNEKRSLRTPVVAGKQYLVFSEIPQDSVIRSLRVDPINDHAVVRIDRVFLTNHFGMEALGRPVALNAAHADATAHWFSHEDPQFHVEVPEEVRQGLQEVTIDLEFIAVGATKVAESLRALNLESAELAKDGGGQQQDDPFYEAFEVLSGKDAGIPAAALQRDTAKLITFYLPQYHRIPENSEWWGPGFTEWTNVVKGRPNYEGHYQPHLPRELGFYDLSNIGVLREQVEMAKLYGVHAFCFYYYWFSGRRILEKPLEDFLRSDIDFNYCLCWANENWTRTWDGDTRSVLMEQKYAESDPEEFIKSLLPYFHDRRYIRVDEKPMLVVYRAKEIPNAKEVFAAWRRASELAGFAGLHINVVDFYDISHPNEVDADALTEFPPHKFNGVGSNPDEMPTITNPEFGGSIVDYAKVIKQSVERNKPDFTLYRTAMPSWDNTARRQNTPTVLHGATPALFGEWLRYLRAFTREHCTGKPDNFIFVNAWNEWGEGCHLEPDQVTGLRNLDALAKSAWFDSAILLGAASARALEAAAESIVARKPAIAQKP